MINNYKMRLTYGSTHVEFYLLSNNHTGVRECVSNSFQSNSRLSGTSPLPDNVSVTSNSISFDAFWRRISSGTLSLSSSFNSTNEIINTGNSLLWRKSPAIDLKIDSPYHASPSSFPSQVIIFYFVFFKY